MDEYLTLLVLAHFKHRKAYSITEIAKTLGVSVEKIVDIVDTLIKNERLTYSEGLLQLTYPGRLFLQNHYEDSYSFDEQPLDIPKIDPSKAWSIDKIYIPEQFHKKM